MDRFWSKVNIKGADDCWEWTGSVTKGKYCSYGLFTVGRKMYKPHRIAWSLTNGDIQKGSGYHGVCVLHACDNPLCCNPKHLFLGSNKDNIKDRDEKGRQNHKTWNGT